MKNISIQQLLDDQFSQQNHRKLVRHFTLSLLSSFRINPEEHTLVGILYSPSSQNNFDTTQDWVVRYLESNTDFAADEPGFNQLSKCFRTAILRGVERNEIN